MVWVFEGARAEADDDAFGGAPLVIFRRPRGWSIRLRRRPARRARGLGGGRLRAASAATATRKRSRPRSPSRSIDSNSKAQQSHRRSSSATTHGSPRDARRRPRAHPVDVVGVRGGRQDARAARRQRPLRRRRREPRTARGARLDPYPRARHARPQAAVDVLRTRSLVRVVARPSDRCFVAIDAPAAQGATQRRYACFPDYCSCPPFFEAAKAVETAVLCKHMLAARLACGAPASPCCVHRSARDRSAGPSSARSRRSTSTTASTTRSSPAGPRCDA